MSTLVVAPFHQVRVAEVDGAGVLARLDDLLDNVAVLVGVGDGVVLGVGGVLPALATTAGSIGLAGVLDVAPSASLPSMAA